MKIVNHWRAAAPLLLCCLLSGCGLAQSIHDGSQSMATSLFYKKIKTLHLDLSPRAALNADETQIPLATMVRVYQLKDRKSLDSADYQALLRDDSPVLKGDVLASRSLLVMPGGNVTLNMPMDEHAAYVAVVALFRQPDLKKNTWRVVLSRDDLDPDKARTVELGDGWLSLVPLKEKHGG